MIIGLKILIWLITTILLSNCTLGPTNTAAPAPAPPPPIAPPQWADDRQHSPRTTAGPTD